MTNPKDEKPSGETGDAAGSKPPLRRFDSTLPMGKPGQSSNVRRDENGDLDLDVGDIQTRLPYGSEDIADK